MSADIAINGKFLLASLEGMPRVGREIVTAMDQLLAEPGAPALRMRLLTPPGGGDRIRLNHIPVEEVGRHRGLWWEQIELPRHLDDRYCVHFTATAPILLRNGCVVVHDAQFRSTPSSHSARSRLLYGGITPVVARRYRDVVTVSHYARDEIDRFGVTRRSDLHVIHNGADHVLARRPDRSILARMALVAGEYMLANSYIHAHKNVAVLLAALRRPLTPARPLVLFGSSGPEQYAERGLALPDGVVFTGRISDEELVALMAEAGLFLFPSLTEGFGLPPLEAMTLGCATINARAGAMPEVCGDGAHYVTPDDPAAWRAAIEHFWSRPEERRALAEAGRKRAQAFTWRAAAKAYLALFERAAERAATGRRDRAGDGAVCAS